MKVTIIGAGAMGSTVGGYFSMGGADVRLVAPSFGHIERINENGLRMNINGSETVVHMRGYHTASEIGEKADLVVIVTKGHQIDEAIRSALCLFDENTACMAIQNGIGNIDILSRYLPLHQIYAAIAQLGASRPEPGKVNVLKRDGAMLSFGPVAQEEPTDRLIEAARVLTRGGLDASALTRLEINRKIWYKMTANCTGNACCAITRLPLGRFTNCPEGVEIKTALLEEILAVAECEGVTGLRELVTATNYWPENNPMYRHIPSTAQDVQRKHKTEIDFLNGAIVRLGKKHGIATPCNTLVTDLIHIIENNYEVMF